MDNFVKLRELVASLEVDFERFFEKDNNAAGTRVRKSLQEIKNLSQEIRNEVTAIKNKSK